MFVSFVRRDSTDFLFLAEFTAPDGCEAFIRSAGFVPRQWYRVNPTYVDAVECPPRDFLELCLYAYGHGFLRNLYDECWQYRPVPVLQRLSPGTPYQEGKLALVNRLIEEMCGETAMGYLLAEIRVLGEKHSSELITPQHA